MLFEQVLFQEIVDLQVERAAQVCNKDVDWKMEFKKRNCQPFDSNSLLWEALKHSSPIRTKLYFNISFRILLTEAIGMLELF